MSYILEALKKSQQERELGQVPTLETSSLFSDDRDTATSHHWGLLAVGLAALAVVIALYAVLQTPAPSPDSARPEVGVPTQTAVTAANEVPAGQPVGPGNSSAERVPDASAAVPATPLVEAPPPKQRSWERSAAPSETFDDEEMPLPDTDQESEESMADTELELELQRQLEEEQTPDRESLPLPPLRRPQRPPVPADLVDDIESFKQQVRREQGIPPPESQRQPAKITGDPTRLRLTPEQQAQLPGYLMTVHVYDAEPAKRFVLINSLKYREGEETREGLRVEQILPQGAVLSYLGQPFFVRR